MAAAARTHATDRGFDHPRPPASGLRWRRSCPRLRGRRAAARARPSSSRRKASVLSAFGTLVTLGAATIWCAARSAASTQSTGPNVDTDPRRADISEGLTTHSKTAGCRRRATCHPASSAPTCAISASKTRSRSSLAARSARQGRDIARRSAISFDARLSSPSIRRQSLARADRDRQLAGERVRGRDIELRGHCRDPGRSVSANPRAHRPVAAVGGRSAGTPVYDRCGARSQARPCTGPAIVEERETTIVLPAPLGRRRSIQTGCLIATRKA